MCAFIKTVAAMMDLNTSRIQFRSLGSSDKYRKIFTTLATADDSTIPPIHYLRDPNFRIGVASGLQATNEFFWDLPSIKSYLFVDYCERHKNDPESPLAFLIDKEAIFATAYVNSFH
jgi:hypothetical protein